MRNWNEDTTGYSVGAAIEERKERVAKKDFGVAGGEKSWFGLAKGFVEEGNVSDNRITSEMILFEVASGILFPRV